MRYWILTLISVFILAGCGSSPKNETVNKDQKNPEKDIAVKSTPAPRSVKKAPEWLLVFTTQDIEEEDKVQFLEAVEKKWFKDIKHETTELDKFESNRKDYVGTKVVFVQILYAYGEYEFIIRSDKVVEKKGKLLQEPYDEGPYNFVRAIESPERLVKEIMFMKNSPEEDN